MLRKGSIYLNSDVYYNFSVRFHQAIIEDFFGLTLNQLKSRGFYFIGWGFSYQAFDTKSNRPLCDFKFDSSTINHGEMFGTEPGLETIEHGPRKLQDWIKVVRFCSSELKYAVQTCPLTWYSWYSFETNFNFQTAKIGKLLPTWSKLHTSLWYKNSPNQCAEEVQPISRSWAWTTWTAKMPESICNKTRAADRSTELRPSGYRKRNYC